MKTKKSGSQFERVNRPSIFQDHQVLLRLLVAQATNRVETLAKLARALGVTYARLAQWRRQKADICRAQRSAHENHIYELPWAANNG